MRGETQVLGLRNDALHLAKHVYEKSGTPLQQLTLLCANASRRQRLRPDARFILTAYSDWMRNSDVLSAAKIPLI